MSRIFVHGWGAVSPAGWDARSLFEVIEKDIPLPTQPLACPGLDHPLTVRRVPAPIPRPSFLSHPRLRRTSPITHFAVGAATEALGAHLAASVSQPQRLGIISCAFAGCVNYSRRFYDETLRDPSTASPLVFPETVFNAPASHIAAFFGASSRNYTIVGDQGEFLKAFAVAADWLQRDLVDGCLIVAAEEVDWLTASALDLFARGAVAAEGAGAVYLRRDPSPIELIGITEPELYLHGKKSLRPADTWDWPLSFEGGATQILSDGLSGIPSADQSESAAFEKWRGKRLSPKKTLGEGLAAAAAWQVIAGIESIRRGLAELAFVAVVGANEQALGAVFQKG